MEQATLKKYLFIGTWSPFFYEKGGGSLPDLGVYNITTLTGLLGPAKEIVAMTSIVTATRRVADKPIRVEAEDNAMLIMDHGDSVLSHIDSAGARRKLSSILRT